MFVTIRLTKTLHDEMMDDLRRPHAHAAERVGFLYGRLAAGADALILMTRYIPVNDDGYVYDSNVGARINGDAIRAAMQGAVDSGDGVFHAHLHRWSGRPSFSAVDRLELPKLIPAFQAISGRQATGLFLLSEDSAIAQVWLPRINGAQLASRITAVGYRTHFLEHQT